MFRIVYIDTQKFEKEKEDKTMKEPKEYKGKETLVYFSVTLWPIGGGYGTGAEIAQYFGVKGLVGGLLGMVVTLIVWSVLCAVSYEFVRIYKTYDYNSMMGKLLGKAGVLYEICYIVLMLIVLGCALSYGALASLGFDWSGLNMTVGDLAVSFS